VSDLKCQVIEITRGTTHDGPGMRTTVFLKGCPLNCVWCQNPEGIKPGQNIWWEERKCIRCLSCMEACPNSALIEDAQGIHLDRSKCTGCGDCVEACPAQAMTATSQEWTIDPLVGEVLKDKEYYRAFGGGVTVSGGEPLAQYKFVAEFFKRLREQGVHTALDTCGMASLEALRSVLPYTDAVLFDIKLIDPGLHKRYTGQTNQTILENLLVISETIRQVNREKSPDEAHRMKLWIRTPLIPDTTATEENISSIGAFIHDNLQDVVERWELCAFNNACRSKYQKLDLTWEYADVPLMRQNEIDRLKAAALSAGIPGGKLVVSGLVAKENS
jgi:pyruvate formate lyase activating enzyme